MKKTGLDIYTYIKRNNIIVYGVLFFSILTTGFSLGFAYLVYKQSKNVIYSYNGKGDIVPLKLLESKENRIEQVKANLDLFVNYFYTLDQNSWKNNIEKSLWLGGQNIELLYKKKSDEGYFNQFIQYNIIQKPSLMNVKVLSIDEPYTFTAQVHLELYNGSEKENYLVDIKGSMIEVSINYPKNPFGLLINAYEESKITLVETKD